MTRGDGRQKRWRAKAVIEAEKRAAAIRKFWRDNPMARFDRQYRYLVNCGVVVDPLTFKFSKYEKGDICPDSEICRSYKTCAICDGKRATVYSWDGHICIGCSRRIHAKNALLRHCQDIDDLILKLKRKVREARKGPEDKRRPQKVPVRNDGEGFGRDDRREESHDGRQAGSPDQ